LQTNYLPEISGRDRGVWRRIRVVPWTAHFKRNKDENLDDVLRGEAPGILRWCVNAVHLYLKFGLDEPPEVLDATKAYRDREDIIGRWMTECGFIFDADLSIEAIQLTKSWQDWSGSQFGNPRRFHEVAYALEAAGCPKHRKGSPKVTWWTGIGLMSD
jgi:putative DNA primase/helicase